MFENKGDVDQLQNVIMSYLISHLSGYPEHIRSITVDLRQGQ